MYRLIVNNFFLLKIRSTKTNNIKQNIKVLKEAQIKKGSIIVNFIIIRLSYMNNNNAILSTLVH